MLNLQTNEEHHIFQWLKLQARRGAAEAEVPGQRKNSKSEKIKCGEKKERKQAYHKFKEMRSQVLGLCFKVQGNFRVKDTQTRFYHVFFLKQ